MAKTRLGFQHAIDDAVANGKRYRLEVVGGFQLGSGPDEGVAHVPQNGFAQHFGGPHLGQEFRRLSREGMRLWLALALVRRPVGAMLARFFGGVTVPGMSPADCQNRWVFRRYLWRVTPTYSQPYILMQKRLAPSPERVTTSGTSVQQTL